MTKYIVYLANVASTSVEVEAENGDEAVEKALSGNLPFAAAFSGFELSEWTTPSELFPKFSKPEDDYEEID